MTTTDVSPRWPRVTRPVLCPARRSGSVLPCELPTGHDGPHRDAAGQEWDAGAPTCNMAHPGHPKVFCDREWGHPGPHATADNHWRWSR
jgi:hypothetical protein